MSRWLVSSVPVVVSVNSCPSAESTHLSFCDLIAAPVNGFHRARVDEFEDHGVVARALEIVLLSVKTGGIAEVTQKMNRAASVRLDFEHQPLPQTALAEVLCPLTGEQVSGDPCSPASGPHGDLIGVILGYSGDR